MAAVHNFLTVVSTIYDLTVIRYEFAITLVRLINQPNPFLAMLIYN